MEDGRWKKTEGRREKAEGRRKKEERFTCPWKLSIVFHSLEDIDVILVIPNRVEGSITINMI